MHAGDPKGDRTAESFRLRVHPRRAEIAGERVGAECQRDRADDEDGAEDEGGEERGHGPLSRIVAARRNGWRRAGRKKGRAGRPFGSCVPVAGREWLRPPPEWRERRQPEF